MLTTGGKKRTIVSLGANCGLDSLFEKNECSFSTVKVPISMKNKTQNKIGFKGEEIQGFDGCSA